MDAGIQPVSTGTGTAAPVSDVTSDADQAATDFETFLTLLTAQLRNQDPLQPIDSTQFVAQLASFSSVEQQVKTNGYLSELTTSLTGNSPERLVGLIGHEVPAPVAAVFGGAPVDLQFHADAAASSATLVVRDAAGAVVGNFAIDPAAGAAQWDGTLTNGLAVTGSQYSFEIETTDAGGAISRQPGLVFAPVTQVRFDADEPLLGFADGTEIALSDVLQIRAPGA